MVQRGRLDLGVHERLELCMINVGGWVPTFTYERFSQLDREHSLELCVVNVGSGLCKKKKACFTLSSHSSMVKLVVTLGVWDLHSLSSTICCTGCFAGTGFPRVPGHGQLLVR